jgi:hypothetical protein
MPGSKIIASEEHYIVSARELGWLCEEAVSAW